MKSNASKVQQQQVNAQSIAGTLVRRKELIALCTLAGLALATGLALVLPETFEASSTVAIMNRRMVDPLVSDLAVASNLKEELSLLTRQMLSWPKLEQVLAQLTTKLKFASLLERERFIRALRKRVRVETRGNEIIEITYQDGDPARAQEVVNLLTQILIDEGARIKREEARNAIDFINGQLKIYRSKLESSEQNFSVNKIEADLRMAENRRQLIRDKMRSIKRTVKSQVTMGTNPVVAQLLSQLGQLEGELARLMVDARPENPNIQSLKQHIAQIKKRVAAEREQETVAESVSIANPAYIAAEQEFKQVEMDIEFLAKRKNELLKRGVAEKGVTEEELSNLGRGKQVDEDIYQMLLRQIESAYVSERLQGSEDGGRFTVIEYARYPLEPVKPNHARVIFTGLMAGFGIGLGLAFREEGRDECFRTVDAAKQALSIPLLGAVSRIEGTIAIPAKSSTAGVAKLLQPQAGSTGLKVITAPPPAPSAAVSAAVVIHHQPRSRTAEEYRMVHAHIRGFESETPLRTLMFTSALKGEGKSTTAANLAVTLANKGKRTLLVDCDLRQGIVHGMFGTRRNPGLTDVLEWASPLREACIGSGVEHLSILPRGKDTERPFELLGSARINMTFTEMKEMYDIVLFDAPPALTIPDGIQLAGSMDGVVLVVQAERTQRKDVLSVVAMLNHARARLLGYVLAGTSGRMPKHVHDYYYGRTT